MRGTGSNTLVAEEVFVPAHRVMSLTGAIGGTVLTEHKDEALYRAAFMPVLVIILVGPPLGLARAALECFGEQVPSRGIIYTSYERQAEAPVTHEQIAEAAMLIDSAHLHAMRAADDIDRAAGAGEYPDLVARARIRMDCSRAVHYAREAVNRLVSASGGSAFAEHNPLQRIWRDINTSSLHGILTHRTNLEMYGRLLLGLPQNSPLI
jgi:alkylation response protein AidB-like acyl-CoA dehydrogenase